MNVFLYIALLEYFYSFNNDIYFINSLTSKVTSINLKTNLEIRK